MSVQLAIAICYSNSKATNEEMETQRDMIVMKESGLLQDQFLRLVAQMTNIVV